jgi:hypothetical protein
MRRFTVISAVLAVVALAWSPAFASDSSTETIVAELAALKQHIAELEQALAAIQREQQRQAEEAAAAPVQEGQAGEKAAGLFGDRLHLHGYGELHYNSRKSSDTIKDGRDLPAVMDFHRFVWGLRYNFTDRIVLDSEIDFEHATQEMELEFAHLDFKFRDPFNVRIGSVLVPVGSLNEFHEPPLFHSVERPYFHNFVIPTSWMEGGLGAYGTAGDFSYRAYILSGLSAVALDSKDTSAFDPASGIRKGRQRLMNNKKSYAENLAVAGRLEWKGVPGLQLGASVYTGDSGQDAEDLATGPKDVGDANVTITAADARYEKAGFRFLGEYARIRVGDADKISAVLGKTMGSRIEGWYLEGSYDVLRQFDTDHELHLFARYENLDTHARVPSGMMRNPTYDRRIRTFGLSYKPHHQVALKTDVELWSDAAGQDLTRFNMGFGYDF